MAKVLPVPEHKGDLLIKGKMVNLPLYTVNPA
jgi:hypothetical protein